MFFFDGIWKVVLENFGGELVGVEYLDIGSEKKKEFRIFFSFWFGRWVDDVIF